MYRTVTYFLPAAKKNKHYLKIIYNIILKVVMSKTCTIWISSRSTVFTTSTSRIVTEWWSKTWATMTVAFTVANTITIAILGTAAYDTACPQGADCHTFLIHTHLFKKKKCSLVI